MLDQAYKWGRGNIQFNSLIVTALELAEIRTVVIINSKFIKRCSESKHGAPAYSQALCRIRGPWISVQWKSISSCHRPERGVRVVDEAGFIRMRRLGGQRIIWIRVGIPEEMRLSYMLVTALTWVRSTSESLRGVNINVQICSYNYTIIIRERIESTW